MRIIITGNMGYVGSIVTRYLRANAPDAEIIGFDSGYLGHSPTVADALPELLLNRQYFGDVRDFPAGILDSADALVHLAAISNDPMGTKFDRGLHRT